MAGLRRTLQPQLRQMTQKTQNQVEEWDDGDLIAESRKHFTLDTGTCQGNANGAKGWTLECLYLRRMFCLPDGIDAGTTGFLQGSTSSSSARAHHFGAAAVISHRIDPQP